MADLAPLIRQRFFDANGEPLSGGKLWSYVAGTTTPIQTYTDRSGTSFNTNPIILDSEGYCDVWLGPGYFKFVLMDSNDVTIWTKDNVSLTTNSNESLPSGGLANTFLKKNSEVDFDCSWVSLAKSDVGLGNVDNTSDANKPISTATQTALDLKADDADLTAHIDDEVAAHQATAIFYDTNVSFLVADNVQQAIDELKGLIDNVDALPSQTGNAGKYLTTDGTDASWGTVDALPTQTGQAGKVLTTNGTTASWETPNGLPAGGTVYQTLIKGSSTDGDAAWGFANVKNTRTINFASSDKNQLAGDQVIIIDPASGDVTYMLDDAAPVGTEIEVVRLDSSANSNIAKVAVTTLSGITLGLTDEEYTIPYSLDRIILKRLTVNIWGVY